MKKLPTNAQTYKKRRQLTTVSSSIAFSMTRYTKYMMVPVTAMVPISLINLGTNPLQTVF